MAATVEEVYFEVNSSFYFREKIIEQYFTILLRHMALLISAVNLDFAKSFRDGCQYLRTSVDYPIFLILLQVCKCLDVTSASPTPLRKNFPTFAAVLVSSTETKCVTADHVRPNDFPIYRTIIFHALTETIITRACLQAKRGKFFKSAHKLYVNRCATYNLNNSIHEVTKFFSLM